MSNPYYRKLSLAGIDLSSLTPDDLRLLVGTVIEQRIHGICFSAYAEGQGPGHRLDESQIRERLEIVRPYVSWVRSFSCTEGNELIPAIARELGLKTLVGVWLDDDRANNDLELANAIEIVERGEADVLGVGNEVLLRGDLDETVLIEYIDAARQADSDVPVGYVDAYFNFVGHPAVAEACDVILANCYPFWEGCPAEHALLYMKEMFRQAVRAGDGKRVIVAETGWPSVGTAVEGAVPSFENAAKYFLDTSRWADEDDIEMFYFSAFDEAWKIEREGDVGAFWGLWDNDGHPKFW